MCFIQIPRSPTSSKTKYFKEFFKLLPTNHPLAAACPLTVPAEVGTPLTHQECHERMELHLQGAVNLLPCFFSNFCWNPVGTGNSTIADPRLCLWKGQGIARRLILYSPSKTHRSASLSVQLLPSAYLLKPKSY